MSTLSLGERRVRTTFNPSLSSSVDLVKQKAAELINIYEAAKPAKADFLKAGASIEAHESLNEKFRLISLAQTSIEESAMWAVKAITTNI